MNFVIAKIENNTYTVINQQKQQFSINLTLYDLSNTPKVGDLLSFSNKLLDPNYPEFSHEYTFGNINEPYGRTYKGVDDVNSLTLKISGKLHYLKRFFG